MTNDEIKIDGTKDAVYEKGLKVEVNTIRESGKPATASGTAYYLHDSENIYLFIEVTDTELTPNDPAKQTGSYWEVDGVECMFDWANNGKKYWKYIVWYDGWVKPDSEALGTDIADIVALQTGDDSYVIEYKIPMEGMATTGSKVGVNLLIDNMTSAGRVIVRAPQSLNANENGVEKYDYIELSDTVVTGVEAKKTETTAAQTADPIVLTALSAAAAAGVVVSKKRK